MELQNDAKTPEEYAVRLLKVRGHKGHKIDPALSVALWAKIWRHKGAAGLVRLTMHRSVRICG